jgi:hypothetical protein
VETVERIFWASYYQEHVAQSLQTEEAARIIAAADDYFYSVPPFL